MTRYLFLLVFAISFSLNLGYSQGEIRGTCGNTDPLPFLERIQAHKEALTNAPLVLRSSVTKYVPLTIILVADDNGNGYAREEQVLAEIASLNRQYAPQEMVFYLANLKYKADSRIYNTPASNGAVFQMNLVRDNSSLNIFVTQAAESGSGNPGTTLGYFSRENDWVVVRKSEFNGASGTLAHELGHFFSLAHPHSGWECEPYDEDIHGNPVESFWSPCNGSIRVEFQDGSNCDNSGDFVCDTPPDYNFGFGWSVQGDQCAPYTREVRDPQGEIVDPMEENIMGYFIDCEEYVFTPNQQSLIQADYFSSSRAYLRTGIVPATDTVINDVVYNYPINGEESPTYTQVELDWDDVDGANMYLFIIDRFNTFSFQPERYIVSESSIVLEELAADRQYYWRVWPFNESMTGAGWASTQDFFTGVSSAVNTIDAVDEVNVFPNPVTSGSLTLAVKATSTIDADVYLTDMSGRTVLSAGSFLIEGGSTWTQPVDVSGLVPAMYILQIVSDQGIITEKVSVQ